MQFRIVMKLNDSSHNDTNGVLVAVPQPYLDSLLENQKEILALLKGNNNHFSQMVGDYITEEEAQKILGRKATWFWGMRTKGKLAFSKVGNKNYYSIADIEKLLTSNKKETFGQTVKNY
jgi:hypothetical protein